MANCTLFSHTTEGHDESEGTRIHRGEFVVFTDVSYVTRKSGGTTLILLMKDWLRAHTLCCDVSLIRLTSTRFPGGPAFHSI